ncbi:MAG: hypothetical protein ACI8ZN_001940 [Bacteroidia bacterium]|jgi:hypothetical protein
MKIINLLTVLGILFTLFISACKEDVPEDPIIPNEEEVITSLNFTLTPEGGGTPVVLSFKDLDGDGGNAPAISEGTLVANTTYNGSLELLKELETPAEDITKEIEEEGVDHQFFFKTSVSGVNFAYNDMDANGNPIGLSTILTTNGAGSGTITVTLRHEPKKDASGVSSGDMTNAGGETDIEVTFNVEVQ